MHNDWHCCAPPKAKLNQNWVTALKQDTCKNRHWFLICGDINWTRSNAQRLVPWLAAVPRAQGPRDSNGPGTHFGHPWTPWGSQGPPGASWAPWGLWGRPEAAGTLWTPGPHTRGRLGCFEPLGTLPSASLVRQLRVGFSTSQHVKEYAVRLPQNLDPVCSL